MTPKYPHVQVQLSDEDDSAPAIVARCRRAAQHAGIAAVERDNFMREAFSGDYDNLIATAMAWFDCH
ncbi:hypothetical protein [Primorskyibacter sp. 2E233]|uniref:hypothetical protein n=1 Tax=Primorskyibacter sp. 2E233 TaxID=3413431 RepID=UPI003BEF5D6A